MTFFNFWFDCEMKFIKKTFLRIRVVNNALFQVKLKNKN